MCVESPKLRLIQGGRAETVRLLAKLWARPEQFGADEFDELLTRFEDRLSAEERIELLVRRIRRGPRGHCLEERALIEMMVGDLEEGRRLRDRVLRRRALGLAALASGVEADGGDGENLRP